MFRCNTPANFERVSLFTREWIEIPTINSTFLCWQSPSLRGSGLKSVSQERIRNPCKSPSLRGSGLKLAVCSLESELSGSPSLRGSGLKFVRKRLLLFQMVVSLFTREWIEICHRSILYNCDTKGLPLYEGVDWNKYSNNAESAGKCLPLYEGVDWNLNLSNVVSLILKRLPLYEGVDWNWCSARPRRDSDASPSLRGSGLKLRKIPLLLSGWWRLPLYEGVDWNRLLFACRR